MNARIIASDDTVEITCTIGDLYLMNRHGMAVYATPTPEGKAAQCYLGCRPTFRFDFVIADLGDFLEAAGWTELEDDPDEGSDLDEVTITIPRDRHARAVEES